MEKKQNQFENSCVLVAMPYTILVMTIDWCDGYIYPLEMVHQALIQQQTQDELLDHHTSFTLTTVLYKYEYREIISEIQPLLDLVKKGYKNNGSSERASFTIVAQQQREQIYSILENFDYQITSLEAPLGEDFYADEIPLSQEIIDQELTEIHAFENLLLNHTYTDEQISRLTSREHMGHEKYVNKKALYEYFLDLRDICLSNFKKQNEKNLQQFNCPKVTHTRVNFNIEKTLEIEPENPFFNKLHIFSYAQNRFQQFYLNIKLDECMKRFESNMNARLDFEIIDEGWDCSVKSLSFSAEGEAWLGNISAQLRELSNHCFNNI
tara:strand:- start:31303 stop:32271 length:969 start_codon:yes stop_codon:yes gene_type:complete